jgi:hypothetical protein
MKLETKELKQKMEHIIFMFQCEINEIESEYNDISKNNDNFDTQLKQSVLEISYYHIIKSNIEYLRYSFNSVFIVDMLDKLRDFYESHNEELSNILDDFSMCIKVKEGF